MMLTPITKYVLVNDGFDVEERCVWLVYDEKEEFIFDEYHEALAFYLKKNGLKSRDNSGVKNF